MRPRRFSKSFGGVFRARLGGQIILCHQNLEEEVGREIDMKKETRPGCNGDNPGPPWTKTHWRVDFYLHPHESPPASCPLPAIRPAHSADTSAPRPKVGAADL